MVAATHWVHCKEALIESADGVAAEDRALSTARVCRALPRALAARARIAADGYAFSRRIKPVLVAAWTLVRLYTFPLMFKSPFRTNTARITICLAKLVLVARARLRTGRRTEINALGVYVTSRAVRRTQSCRAPVIKLVVERLGANLSVNGQYVAKMLLD